MGTLSGTQEYTVEQIIAAGRAQGASQQEIITAIATAIPESGLNPAQVGDSGQALGVFQQHPSYGDAATRTNVYTAATAFFKQLINLRASGEPLSVRAADIQRPAGWHPGGPSKWTGHNPFLYGESIAQGLTDFNQVSGSPYTGSVADFNPPAGAASSDFGPVIHPGVGTGGTSSDPLTGRGSSNAAPGILHAIDKSLNDFPGIVDTAKDPAGAIGTTGSTILARGGVVLAGGVIGVFGLILLVSAVGKRSQAIQVAGALPGPAGQVTSTVAEAVI